MLAANCCPQPGYGAASKQDGTSGSYTGEVNACGEAHEPSLGGSHALEHWPRCHEPDQHIAYYTGWGGHCPAFGVRRWKRLKPQFFWIRKRWRRISGCTAKTMI